jgi:dihydrofolate reductase
MYGSCTARPLHTAFAPSPELFRHFIEEAQGQAGSVYGRHVSRTLKSVGPNASLVGDDLAGAIRALRAERDGEIEVVGPNLARSLTELGLIDEYQIYLHPVVLGHGKPYFAGPRPPLRLRTHDRIGEDVIRLVYMPA